MDTIISILAIIFGSIMSIISTDMLRTSNDKGVTVITLLNILYYLYTVYITLVYLLS